MHIWPSKAAGWLLAPILLLASACGAADASPQASAEGRLSIVAAFYPFAYVAERVAGDHATVTGLTPPGAEPHDVELTPRQVGSLTDAALVVYEKTFQFAVDEAVAQSGNPNALDTATVVPLQSLAPADEDQLGDAEHGHEEEGLDPHVWLDPENLAAIGNAVADRLATLDPADAADYRRNAAALKADLDALAADFRTGLGSCKRTQFVTQHAAFGYLARRYHLTQVSISGLSPDTEPSPARVAEVQQLARRAGVTTIFYETLVSPSVARTIAGDLGLRTDVLDPIEGITDQSRGRDYPSVMRANLAALRTANGCS